jgi:hypothetical protein
VALRGSLTHRKTRRLAQALRIAPCFALGIMEALWHVAAENAPSGAVGRMTDEDIAMEMFYDDDPAKLIEALVVSGLLDRDPVHRLVVHDWHIHSDDATDNKLARATQYYANGEMPRMRRIGHIERDKLEQKYANPCARKTTTSHGEPLPVPEPVPVPVNTPQPPSREGGKKPTRAERKSAAANVGAFPSTMTPEQAREMELGYWRIKRNKGSPDYEKHAPMEVRQALESEGERANA